MPSPKEKPLTAKQTLFVNAYLDTLNGTDAAKRAGYKGSRTALAVVASRNLRKANIRAALAEGLIPLAMPKDEVIARLTAMARADLSDFVTIDKNGITIDAGALGSRGHLVKKLEETAQGMRLELHDPMTALTNLAKIYAMFVDRIEIMDWREELRKHDVEPSKVFEEYVKQFMDVQSDSTD